MFLLLCAISKTNGDCCLGYMSTNVSSSSSDGGSLGFAVSQGVGQGQQWDLVLDAIVTKHIDHSITVTLDHGLTSVM